MAPIYEYSPCSRCSPDSTGRIEVVRPISRASDPEPCGTCGASLERVYSVAAKPEFTPYYDEKSGSEIRSYGQEARAWKKTGRISAHDVPKSDRVRAKIDLWKHRQRRGLA